MSKRLNRTLGSYEHMTKLISNNPRKFIFASKHYTTVQYPYPNGQELPQRTANVANKSVSSAAAPLQSSSSSSSNAAASHQLLSSSSTDSMFKVPFLPPAIKERYKNTNRTSTTTGKVLRTTDSRPNGLAVNGLKLPKHSAMLNLNLSHAEQIKPSPHIQPEVEHILKEMMAPLALSPFRSPEKEDKESKFPFSISQPVDSGKTWKLIPISPIKCKDDDDNATTSPTRGMKRIYTEGDIIDPRLEKRYKLSSKKGKENCRPYQKDERKRFISSKFRNHQNSSHNGGIDTMLIILSLRCQSFSYLRLYHMKRAEVREYSKVLIEYQKVNSSQILSSKPQQLSSPCQPSSSWNSRTTG